jgi:Sigma-70, region 4
MASIDSLPADQRAVLELVLRRGRSYDEIARLLSIDRAGVRQRALAAFDALGPKTRVAANRRALIADYLLDALPGGVAEEVREHLGTSASERAWARAVASELQPLSEHELPEIPANGRRPPKDGEDRKPPRTGRARATTKDAPQRAPEAEVPAAAALSNGTARPKSRGSRLGGAVLLAILAAIAIALVLIFVVFNGGSAHHRALHQARTHGRTTPSASTGTSKLLSQIALASPSGGKTPDGRAYVVSVQNELGLLVAARGLKPNTKHPANSYALWLYNSPSDSHILGFVTPAVGKNGSFNVPAPLPSNASHYRMVIVTLETVSNPKTPGKVVLEGSGKL